MSKIHEYVQKHGGLTQAMFDQYVRDHGGAIIKTVRDEIFTDDRSVNMDTEEIIILNHPLCNGEIVDRVEINPTFIVSITYIEPKSKIALVH